MGKDEAVETQREWCEGLRLPAPAGRPGDPSDTSPATADEDLGRPDDGASPPPTGGGAVLVPTRIGRYRVRRVLGAGGMGIVVLAREASSEREVAIKLIRPECLAEPRMVRAFLREAGHMSRMDHPNVVPVREVSEQADETGPSYVMPHFARGSLSLRIGGEDPLDPEEVRTIARQVAAALRYAHGLGIIHRDVKPSNILIADDGRACLADFGLVRTVFNDTTSGESHHWCVGTPAFMSPAVAAAQPEDTRCDIYGFGAVLYAMLAGVAPYGDLGAKATRDRILAGPPTPIRRLNPAAPAPLVAIAEGAMARELRDRYACMGDVLADLERAAVGRAPRGPHGARPAAPLPAAAGVDATDLDPVDQTTLPLEAARRPYRGTRILRRPAWGMAALAMAIVLCFVHPGERPGNLSPPEAPLPPPGPPIRIEKWWVKIYPSFDDGEWREVSALPFAEAQNYARIEAELSSPACCCLLELLPRGKVEVHHPPEPGGATSTSRPPEPVTRLDVPESDRGYIPFRGDGQGLAAFVLVAWRAPSRIAPEDLRRLAEEKWSGITSAKGADAATWDYDGAVFHRSGRVRGPVVEGPKAPRALEEACRALRNYPGIEAIRARAFPIRGEPDGFRSLPPRDPAAGEAPGDGEEKEVAALGDELEKAIDAGRFAASVGPARKILAIRAASRPADHWEVRTARAMLRSTERLAAMPPDRQHRIKDAWDAFRRAGERRAAGRIDEAEPLFRQAFEAFREALGEDDTLTLVLANEWGHALLGRVSYEAAAVVFRRELAGYRRLFGESHPDTARAHDMLARALQLLGDDEGAVDHGKKALETYVGLLGERSEDAARSCNNTGSYLESLGDDEQAEAMYRRGRGIYRDLKGEDDAETARGDNNLAVIQYRRGRFAEAEALDRKALAIRRKLLGEGHPDTARSRDNLANDLDEQGRFAEAEPMHRRALEDRLRAYGEDHPETILGLSNLGYNLRAQGKYHEAEAMWARAALGFERARSKVAGAGLGRAAFGARRSPMAALAVSLARDGKPREAWERQESDLGRGLFDELAARDARLLSPADRSKERELVGRLQVLEDRITAARMPGGGPRPELERLEAQRDDVQVDLDTFERGLAEKYRDRVEGGRAYGLGRIQGRLDPDVALVGWVDLDLPRGAIDGDGEHWAYLMRAEGEPIWVRLEGSGPGGGWTEDDRALARLVWEMISRKPTPRTEDDWRGPAGRLARLRLGPLLDRLGPTGRLPAARHLVVLPSPALEGVPVEVLHEAPKPADRPPTVSYAPSGTIYAWLRERRPGRDRDGGAGRRGNLLAVGDPALSKDPLPGTREEIRAIAGFFRTPPPTLLLGADANGPNLRKLAGDGAPAPFDVIHLATHGEIDDRNPMRSRLQLSVGMSGPTPGAEDDGGAGFLTAGRILRTWSLDADLVTLSACRTALGRRSGGEGQIGFAQALFRAGSQSLILSLWDAHDDATAALMTEFYREYTKDVGPEVRARRKAGALLHARSRLRHPGDDRSGAEVASRERGRAVEGKPASLRGPKPPYDHPYFWAGFVLLGDPD